MTLSFITTTIFGATPKIEKQEFSLKQGQKFTVELPANPSTGYCWGMLVNQPPKERWIELVKSEFIPDEPGRVGGAGKHKFTFKAMKPTGAAKYGIPLYYCRPTTGEVSEIRSIIVAISP